MKRFIAVILVLCSTAASGSDITYYFADYPCLQADYYDVYVNPVNIKSYPSGGYDFISGTITTDGKMGMLSQADVLGVALTICTPEGTATPIGLIGGNGFATPTEILAPVSGATAFDADDGNIAVDVQYANSAGVEYYSGGIWNVYTKASIGKFRTTLPLSSGPWVIATTADPETFVTGKLTITSAKGIEGTNLIVEAGAILDFNPAATSEIVSGVPEPSQHSMLLAWFLAIVGYWTLKSLMQVAAGYTITKVEPQP